ncbi:MAG: metallophosphoesterase family protein [Akkermansiaceae bacterium]
MRYAIISDLHANLRAWNAVLEDLYEQGVDVVVCLGDVVGYGPNPSEVLKAVRSVTTNFVIGNHDAAAVGMIDYSIFNDHAREAIEWTMTALDSEDKKFISSIPLAIEAEEILFVHAEVCEPGRFGYITDSDTAKENFRAQQHLVTFIGHTHLPKIFEHNKDGGVTELLDNDIRLENDKRYIVNVGSVGEPRDPEDLRARYVIYDRETRDVIFRRVEFDIVSYRNDLEATSLALRPYFLRVFEEVIEGQESTSTYASSYVDMQVSQDSAALINRGQVASVADLSNSGDLLKSAQPSRAPMAIIAIAAILIIGALGFWFISDHKEPESSPQVAEAEAEPESTGNSPPHEKKIAEEQVAKIPKPAPIAKPAPAVIAKVPEKPKPKPVSRPDKKPPEPNPKTLPKVTSAPVKVVWWRMGDGKGGMDEGALVDQAGKVSLFPIKNGKTIRALAPNPIPANQAKNSAAKQLGIWQEKKSENHFALRADQSFTFEGWFFISAFRKPVFLLGTRSSEDDSRGWHLDLRPRDRGQQGQAIGFFYDSGKTQIQAVADNLKIADAAAHHFAIVWDHDKSPDKGDMIVYLDGEEVAVASLPQTEIMGEQFHPLRVGADFNRAKLGLDELRFTRKRLQPHEFLIRAEIQGTTLVKADGRSTDSWAKPKNWQGGKVPSGEQNVIIGPGLKVQINKSKPPAFTGSLVLKEKASLHLWSQHSEKVLPQTEGNLVLCKGSQLVLRSKPKIKLGPIELLGSANIFGGVSTSGHHTTRIFGSKISGSGQLTITGVNNNTFIFEAASTFSGGLITKPQASQKFKVIAAADGCFGKGRVVIGDHASLLIQKGLKNTIANHTALILRGPKGTLDTKLVLESDETVRRFVVGDADQGKGIFDNKSHPEIISGNGKIIVK